MPDTSIGGFGVRVKPRAWSSSVDEVIVSDGFHFLTGTPVERRGATGTLSWSTEDDLAPLTTGPCARPIARFHHMEGLHEVGKVGVDTALLEGLEGLHEYLADSIKSEKLKITRPDQSTHWQTSLYVLAHRQEGNQRRRLRRDTASRKPS